MVPETGMGKVRGMHSNGYRLYRSLSAYPLYGLGKKFRHYVFPCGCRAGLVPCLPYKDTVIFAVARHHLLDIHAHEVESLRHRLLVLVYDGRVSLEIEVMDARHRVQLLADLATVHAVPGSGEETEHYLYAVLVGNGEEVVHIAEERIMLVLPDRAVEEDPDSVETEAGSPSELPVDGFMVVGRGLPHLYLVYGCAREEVASHNPRLAVVPRVGLFHRPWLERRVRKFRKADVAFVLGACGCRGKKDCNCCQE